MITVVSAVIIRESDNRILLARRRLNDRMCPGEWETPGGKVDPGETPADALAREVCEETGLVGTVGGQIFQTTVDGFLGRVFDVRFRLFKIREPIQPTMIENDGLIWATPGEALDLSLATATRRFLEQFTR